MYPSNQRRVELPGSSNRLCPVITPITSHFLCSLLPPCLRTSSLRAPLMICLICSLTEKPSQNVLSAWQMRVINCDQNTLQSLQIRTELLLFKVKNAWQMMSSWLLQTPDANIYLSCVFLSLLPSKTQQQCCTLSCCLPLPPRQGNI